MSYQIPDQSYFTTRFARKLGITLDLVKNIPANYLDGCTFGFIAFGDVKHEDVCSMHDLEWYAIREKWPIWSLKAIDLKMYSDWLYGWRVWRKNCEHNRLGWQVLAAIYAPIAILGLWTFGLLWWKGGVPATRRR